MSIKLLIMVKMLRVLSNSALFLSFILFFRIISLWVLRVWVLRCLMVSIFRCIICLQNILLWTQLVSKRRRLILVLSHRPMSQNRLTKARSLLIFWWLVLFKLTITMYLYSLIFILNNNPDSSVEFLFSVHDLARTYSQWIRTSYTCSPAFERVLIVGRLVVIVVLLVLVYFCLLKLLLLFILILIVVIATFFAVKSCSTRPIRRLFIWTRLFTAVMTKIRLPMHA